MNRKGVDLEPSSFLVFFIILAIGNNPPTRDADISS